MITGIVVFLEKESTYPVLNILHHYGLSVWETPVSLAFKITTFLEYWASRSANETVSWDGFELQTLHHTDCCAESEISSGVRTELWVDQKYLFRVERVKFILLPFQPGFFTKKQIGSLYWWCIDLYWYRDDKSSWTWHILVCDPEFGPRKKLNGVRRTSRKNESLGKPMNAR